MKTSTKDKVLKYLANNPGWTPGYTLEAQSVNFKSMSSQIGRRCRELAHDGIIEKRKGLKGIVEYRLPMLPYEPHIAPKIPKTIEMFDRPRRYV